MSKAPIAVTVRDGRLVPADAYAAEQIDSLPRDTRLNATITVARSGREGEQAGLLRLFHAGINLLFDNVDGAGPGGQWPTPRHLRREIFIGIGFFVEMQLANGTRRDAESIALDKIDLEDFKYIFESCEAYVVKRWGWNPWQAWKEQNPLPGVKP